MTVTYDNSKTCAVLMATYNGEEFLAEQLESIRFQDFPLTKLFISDDGSVDNTQQVIEKEGEHWEKDSFNVRQGPKTGYAGNFMSMLCASDIDADYFAFSDQDDIWESDKLSRALTQLQTIAVDIPALYCSRSQLVNHYGKKIGYSTLFKKKPSFQNALVQCIAGGNTMVINKAARNLLVQTKDAKIFGHDWWTYLMVTGAGGTVIYDPYPTIQYRQHLNNILGRNNNWPGRLRRIQLLFQGGFRKWNTLNCAELQQYRHSLTLENQRILDAFSSAREQKLVARLFGVWNSGVRRQTLIGNLGLLAATLFKRL